MNTQDIGLTSIVHPEIAGEILSGDLLKKPGRLQQTFEAKLLEVNDDVEVPPGSVGLSESLTEPVVFEATVELVSKLRGYTLPADDGDEKGIATFTLKTKTLITIIGPKVESEFDMESEDFHIAVVNATLARGMSAVSIFLMQTLREMGVSAPNISLNMNPIG